MAKRSPKSAEATGEITPSKKRARKARSNTADLWRYALVAIGISSVGVLCAFLVIWWQTVASDNAEHRERLTKAQLESYSAILNAQVAALKTDIDRLATAPTTVQTLRTFDNERIAAENDRLVPYLSHAQRIDIVPKGAAEVDLNSAVPISFAALDVIRRGETQPFVGPEISLQDRGVFYAAQPITIDGRVGGVLFAAISTNYFLKPLTQVPATNGTLLLNQQFEGTSPTAVMQYGMGGSEFDSGASQRLLAPHWTAVFKPSDSLAPPLSTVVDLIAPLALAVGLLLGGIALAFSRLFAKLDAEAETLTDYINRLGRGRGGNLDRYELALFRQIALGASKARRPVAEAPKAERREAPMEFSFDDPEDAPTDDDFDVGDDDDDEKSSGAGPSDFLDVGPPKMEVTEEEAPVQLDPSIFRAYDIRGIVTENLTEEVVYWVARAFAAQAIEQNRRRVVVGGDGRHSTDDLRRAIIRGLNDGGCDAIDIGCVPTPLLYYATHALDTGTGIMITGSHNPPEYNGLKMMIGGTTLAEESIQALRERIEKNDLPEGEGDQETFEIAEHYIERVIDDVAIAQPLKVVVDCGNGVAGLIAPRLLVEMGCEVVPLYAEVDGDFPNHHPDPADPANLEDLITVVKAEKADLGIAFDGDGDRLGVVTNTGQIVWPDKVLMLLARDVVGRNPGADVVYDVKCSRHLNAVIAEYGGRPIMWKTGHSHIKAKLKETGALLGGEFSGHIFFAERWFGFDDAIYSAARLLEIIATENKPVDELFKEFPETFTTPEIKIPTSETAKFEIIERLAKKADFGDGTLTTIDGIRVDYADGFGLIRASNTSPVLSLRFEADGQSALDRIQKTFQEQLSKVDASLKFR